MAAPARLALENIARVFDGRRVIDDLSLEIVEGEVLCLLGPSGCGKTTTLRIAAGVERQSAGRVLLDGKVVSDNAVHEPPERRSVGLMFQDFALFPHLDIAANVAFGLKGGKAERLRQAEEYLDRVGLSGFGAKFPHMLSGGEQQRVALARALVTQPRVLLLDEPLGALDLKMRKKMQGELKALQRTVGITFIYVTHDQEEAMNLSDVIVVMEKGRIAQVGTPEEVYRRPTSPYVADFVGETNFLPGGRAVRPENVLIGGAVGGGVARGNAVVREKSFLGATTRIELEDGGRRLVATLPGVADIAAGDTVAYGWRDEDALILSIHEDSE